MNRPFAAIRRLSLLAGGALFGAGLALPAAPVLAQDSGSVLIRNATVHTAGPQGTLRDTDVLV